MKQILGIAINQRWIAYLGDTTTVGEQDQTSRGNGNLPPLLRELNQRTSLLRKESKIKGQIGEAQQKDKPRIFLPKTFENVVLFKTVPNLFT